MSNYGQPPGDPFQAPPPPPGHPPGPPYQAPGGYPPPGAMPGQPYPSLQPEGESPWKYVLIGCALLAALGMVLLIGTCVYMGHYLNEHKDEFQGWGQKMMSSGLKMAKPQYMNMLTEDHTEDDIENFSYYYDVMAELMEEDMEGFMNEYSVVFNELNMMTQDGRITVKESRDWVDTFDKMLEQRGYWE